MTLTSRWFRLPLLAVAVLPPSAWAADGDDPALARYFGFDDPRFVVVDLGAGPVITADFNGDGRLDIAVVNNRKSRIEIHYQRDKALTQAELAASLKVNEIAPSAWYRREEIPVSHRVSALRAHDFDGDGRQDLIYAGQPPEIVVRRQTEEGTFEDYAKRRVPALAAGRDGLAVADVVGGPEPEVLAIADGRINVFPMGPRASLGEPTRLGSGGGAGQQILAFFVEDYDGNGMLDILGAAPDDAAPARLWLQRPPTRAGASAGGAKQGVIGPELRFEMPRLRELEPVRYPGRAAASIGAIERATRRMVFFDLVEQSIEPSTSMGAEREVQAEVRAFGDGVSKDRAVVVADIDADGLLDLLAADSKGNALVLHRQQKGVGLGAEERFSAFKSPKSLAAGQWDDAGPLEVFVLSEEEKAVGVARYDAGADRLSFPEPLSVATPGASPVAMTFVELRDGPAVAVVVQSKREHTLELHRPAGEPKKIPLTDVVRPPQSMLPADIDGDGAMDLMLFTPGEPMIMVRSLDGADGAPPTVLTDKSMPQFGLVQAAAPDNTSLLDVDGDGRSELLIANANFVRACSFDPTTGWRVVEQVTDPDAQTKFVGLAVLPDDRAPTIVVSDKAAGRLVTMSRTADGWGVTDRMRLIGFDPRAIYAGAFAGDAQPNILCLSDDAYGVVRLAGTRAVLEEFDAWRSDSEDRVEHEMSCGDVNNDGHLDVVVLDAGEQMCQVFTFTSGRRLLEATEFEVFQSRLFTRGEEREYEPSMAIIQDLTGDGANDLLLLCHDRVIVYPQMTRPAD